MVPFVAKGIIRVHLPEELSEVGTTKTVASLSDTTVKDVKDKVFDHIQKRFHLEQFHMEDFGLSLSSDGSKHLAEDILVHRVLPPNSQLFLFRKASFHVRPRNMLKTTVQTDFSFFFVFIVEH